MTESRVICSLCTWVAAIEFARTRILVQMESLLSLSEGLVPWVRVVCMRRSTKRLAITIVIEIEQRGSEVWPENSA